MNLVKPTSLTTAHPTARFTESVRLTTRASAHLDVSTSDVELNQAGPYDTLPEQELIKKAPVPTEYLKHEKLKRRRVAARARPRLWKKKAARSRPQKIIRRRVSGRNIHKYRQKKKKQQRRPV
ncbi:unnamed protein product [Strongylus vulgaris]|uniref:Uncharacterized protein n=1 Tax=Strongylus vulgaris TaxID=40348 RepID=A0A3P7LKS9_STRVU|nr:unnamed protein product [Strongylus vulgaris]